MSELVTLFFGLTVEISPKMANEIGHDLQYDLLYSMFNGEDSIDWSYLGFEVVKLDNINGDGMK